MNTDILTVPTTLENAHLPREMDGSSGSNRATGNRSQIKADNDIDAIKAWLARFWDTKTTFDNYRKEAERLLLWSTVQLGKPLSSLTHEDWLSYQRFLAYPEPATRWVMRDKRKFSRKHPEWRPFSGPLSLGSQRQAAVILNVMFSWLVNAGYLAGNPLSLSRQRSRKAKPRITRYLEDELWSEVKQSIEAMPKETERQCEQYCRLRWLFSLLYLCGLRISEVIVNTMGSFFCRRDRNGQERWWLEILGKGGKLRIVPATNELMLELSRYRTAKGLTPLPLQAEQLPLLLPIGSRTDAMTRGALHSIVKKVFQQTAERLRQRGEQYFALADRVEQASAHWLRHTAGSHMANNDIDLRHIRDNLGHESLSTTNNYLHTTDDARHTETEAGHKINW
ncbi:tyrosine-type recombinase/integrase [Undibacterium sp. JH2W]|uniref:tyrosine-type recombinase/integrase n=1 Tax=Undibacterium sp. JH2W TaxID=3413037 RepID=UPI003BF1AF46